MAGNFQALKGWPLPRFGSRHFRIIEPAQSPQRINHVLTARQTRPPGVSPEFTNAREPAHYDHAEEKEYKLKNLHQQILRPAPSSVAFVPRAHGLAHHERQQPGE